MSKYNVWDKKWRLTILSISKKLWSTGRATTWYECLCECGKTVEYTPRRLSKCNTCGCGKSKKLTPKELNDKYLKDKAISVIVRTDIPTGNRNKDKLLLWRCLCGNMKLFKKSRILEWRINTCGCRIGYGELQGRSPRDTYDISSPKRSPTKWFPRLRAIYKGMFYRCYNTEHTWYENYGMRWIRVDDEWFSYERFLKDMWPVPAWLTLERIDNDKNYGPGNCRWATIREQSRNKRSNISYEGIIMKDWADIMGVGYKWLKKKVAGKADKDWALAEIVEKYRSNLKK